MRTVISIDFGKLMNWQTYAIILIFTAIIGYYNQCDIYEPLNHLPANRTELTPIGKINMKFEDNSNIFTFEIEHHSVLEITKDNLIDAINVEIRTDFFTQKIPLSDSYERDFNMNYLKGKLSIHTIGPIRYQLYYMFEEITEERTHTIEKASLTFPTNSIVDCNYERCEFSHVCFLNSSIYIFSQQKFKQIRNIPTLNSGYTSITSITDHNYKDFQDRNKASVIGDGYVFFGRSKPATNSGRVFSIIKPIIEYFNNATRKDMRVYIIDSSDVAPTDEEIKENFEMIEFGSKVCIDKIVVPINKMRIRADELFNNKSNADDDTDVTSSDPIHIQEEVENDILREDAQNDNSLSQSNDSEEINAESQNNNVVLE